MNRLSVTIVAAAAACLATCFADAASAADPPADRVLAMYFHRTERCPTCQKMGSYAEEAVTTGFADEIEAGTVEFHYIDFEDEKNAKMKEGYGVTGPALIVAKIAENKVAQFKDLEEIWAKVGDKKDFLKYVQENVAAYRE
jgi:hypothetical protein